MKFRFSTILALAAAGVVFSAAMADAAIVTGLNQISYSDREQLATYSDVTHAYTAEAPGSISIGDHLYGVLTSTAETPGVGPPNATAAFDIVVAKIINPATGAAVGPGYTGTAEVLFTTDSTTGGFLTGGTGITYTLADASTVKGLGQAADSLLATYQGSTLTTTPISNLDTGTQSTGIGHATDGTFFGDFGLGAALTPGSSNASWGAAGIGYWASDVTLIGGVLVDATVPFAFGLVPLSQPASSFVGLFNTLIPLEVGGEHSGSDLTNIHNNSALGSPLGPLDPTAGFAPGATPTVATTFTLVGGGHSFPNSSFPANSQWPVGSADPTWVDPKTPEPGTMLLMGMGLGFGACYARRRRKTAA